VTNELLQALAELPVSDAAIRWPDPPDALDTLTVAALVASPAAAAQFLGMAKVALEHATDLDDAAQLLYDAGAYAGGHGHSEVAAMLWDLADAIAGVTGA
jgi:hypothetical protein